jgi:hypothetical protein
MLIDVCATEIVSTFNSKLTLIVLCATIIRDDTGMSNWQSDHNIKLSIRFWYDILWISNNHL